jgi:hypothetical protein
MQAGIESIVAKADDPDAVAKSFAQATRDRKAGAGIIRHGIHAGNRHVDGRHFLI